MHLFRQPKTFCPGAPCDKWGWDETNAAITYSWPDPNIFVVIFSLRLFVGFE